MIPDSTRRLEIEERFTRSGRQIIALSIKQIKNFAGNALELQSNKGLVLALSNVALKALGPKQKAIIEQSTIILPLDIPTIELAGGSVRCMLAGVHLSPR
jgi:hypothetical protein